MYVRQCKCDADRCRDNFVMRKRIVRDEGEELTVIKGTSHL